MEPMTDERLSEIERAICDSEILASPEQVPAWALSALVDLVAEVRRLRVGNAESQFIASLDERLMREIMGTAGEDIKAGDAMYRDRDTGKWRRA